MKTDHEIHKDVTEELSWEPILRGSEIGVAVKDGVVTLSGNVDSYVKKLATERAAKLVSGVKAIAVDVEVRPPGALKKTDTEIAHAIMDALKWNSLVRDEKVKVKVDDGWVTLEGEAEWNYQRESVRAAVENLTGVKGITNLIKVEPVLSMKDVKQKITSAFQRHAVLDAGKISIEAVDGTVTLNGKVRSLAEKNDAELAAWSAPGVRRVVNNLLVEFQQALKAY